MTAWFSKSDRGSGRDGSPAERLWWSEHPAQAVHACSRTPCTYVTNPKVGCSSIIWTLRSFQSGDPTTPDSVGEIHARTGAAHLRPPSAEQARELLGDRSRFTFTFVRNPFDRLMSCYLQKIRRDTPERTKLFSLLKKTPDLELEIPFTTFIEAIETQDPEEMDPHWRVQSAQTLQGVVDYHFIGRFEHFDRDLAEVGSRISPEFTQYVHAERRQATGVKRFDLIDEATANRIRSVFLEDFQRFDYPLDVPAS